MHYYPFNVSDYLSHTGHLNLIEDLAYRRMLDWVYLHEKPLPLDIAEIGRRIGLRDNLPEIEFILSEFFKKSAKGFHQLRVESEIKKFKKKSKTARKNGKNGGRPRKEGAVEEPTNNPVGFENKANQNHNHNHNQNHNHEPVSNKGRFAPPSVQDVAEYCLERGNQIDAEQFVNHYTSNGWMMGRSPMQCWQSAVRKWEKNQYESKHSGNSGSNNRRETPAQEIAAKRRELASQSPDVGVVAEDGGDVRAYLVESTGD